jgi:opacity protein-like surface antigen
MTLAELLKRSVLFLCLGVSLQGVEAQVKPDGPDIYGAKNKFGVMAEYSNDSSHIILGQSENIKLGAVGVQYQRRLFATRYFVFSYAAEFRPVILESIPTQTLTITEVFGGSTIPPQTFTDSPSLTARCVPGDVKFSPPAVPPPYIYASEIITTCGRQTNFAQGLSPAGFRVNFRPRHRLQPTFSTLEGYIFSTKPLPIAGAGSFNFAFELGAGLEYYLAPKRSVRLEYQLQHYSNGYTADLNPGVDSGIFKLSYSFGR